MKWLDVIVSMITTIGSIPPRILVIFFAVVSAGPGLVVLTIRLSGVSKLSPVDGIEFDNVDDRPAPRPKVKTKKVVKRRTQKVLK